MYSRTPTLHIPARVPNPLSGKIAFGAVSDGRAARKRHAAAKEWLDTYTAYCAATIEIMRGTALQKFGFAALFDQDLHDQIMAPDAQKNLLHVQDLARQANPNATTTKMRLLLAADARLAKMGAADNAANKHSLSRLSAGHDDNEISIYQALRIELRTQGHIHPQSAALQRLSRKERNQLGVVTLRSAVIAKGKAVMHTDRSTACTAF